MTDKPTEAVAPTMIALDALCREAKMHPREARARLRLAAKDAKTYPNLAKDHQPRKPWAWEEGSKAIAEARKVLTPASA